MLVAISRLPSGASSTASPGLTWASLRGFGRSVRKAKPVLPVSSTKIETGRLAALLGRNGLVAGVDEEDPQAVDVPLGDPVRRIEGERRLVVLARRAELAQLPERLGQAVLGLRVRAELEQPLVRLRRLGPLGRRRLGDRLVRQLALQARLVDGARWLGIDFGEGHEEVVLSGDDPDPTERAARRTSRWGAQLSSIAGPVRQTQP